MRDIHRRLTKAEKMMNLDKERIRFIITMYGGVLPPDRTEGNITYHYVMYDEKAKQ